jgi:hypothetical protein
MEVEELEIAEEVRGFDSSDRDALRLLARKDLYVMAHGVLGYKDFNPQTHGGFLRFLQSEEKRRRLSLLPRAHLKSTGGTVADSIRLGVDDPKDCRVLIAGETSTLAEKFLSEVKGQFEKNDVLRSLFPELIPERFTGPGVTWRSDMATLQRSSSHKEPTWQAIGVGGASVGSHFTHIKCDDLIGFEALRSPAKMAYTIAWFDNIEPLLVDQNTNVIDVIGTRWSRNDLYAHIMNGYGDSLAVYTRSAIEGGLIIFPALHNWEEYERIQRINPAQWHAQYENNPIVSGKSDFPIESLQHFRFDQQEENVLTPKGKQWRVEDLDRVLTADPNSGSLLAPDAAAISVQGISPDDEVFVLDSWSGRVTPSGFVDEIYRRARRWRVRVVGIEKAGQQNTDHYFKQKIEREGYSVRVEALLPRQRGKEDRVRAALEPLLRSQLLFTLPSQSTLRQQLAEFPDTILWDEVDALAYGPELWRKPMRAEDIAKRGSVMKKLLMMRNSRTGY